MTNDTNDTTEPKRRTITLTDRAPVRITEGDWPSIACGSYEDFDNEYRFQANRTTDISIRVRQHADGRAIVYAVYDYSTAFQHEHGATHRTGVLLESGADLVAAIREVGEQLYERAESNQSAIRDCVNECIAQLPPVEL